MRDGVLDRHWESADGRTKTAQIVIPRSKVKEVSTEMHEGSSGGHLEVNKTFDNIRFKAFAATEFNKILPGFQPRQLVKNG
jgi:hypothetical protein